MAILDRILETLQCTSSLHVACGLGLSAVGWSLDRLLVCVYMHMYMYVYIYIYLYNPNLLGINIPPRCHLNRKLA